MNIIEQIKVNDVSIDGYQGTYYTESLEYVQVTTDAEGKILEGIKPDGSKHITGDLTVDGSIYNDSLNVDVEQIVEDIQERVVEMLEPVEDTLSYFESADNPEWLQMTIDEGGRTLEGITNEGKKILNLPIETPVNETSYADNLDWLEIKTDNEGKIISGLKIDGTTYIENLDGKGQIFDDVNNLKNSYNQILNQEKYNLLKRWIPYYMGTTENKLNNGSEYDRCNILFFTDSHIEKYNNNESYSLNNHLLIIDFIKNCPVKLDVVLLGGDNITPFAETSYSSAMNWLHLYYDALKEVKNTPICLIRGNHDNNDWGNYPSNVVTNEDFNNLWYDYAEQQFGIVRNPNEVNVKVVNGTPITSTVESMYHYYDIQSKKIRIIAVDVEDIDRVTTDTEGHCKFYGTTMSYVAQRQMNWIANTALKGLDEGWGVVFLMHQSWWLSPNSWYGSRGDGVHTISPAIESAIGKLFRIATAFNRQTTCSIQYTYTGEQYNNFYNLNVSADFTEYANMTNKPHVICWLMGHEHTDTNFKIDIDGTPSEGSFIDHSETGINFIWTANAAFMMGASDDRIVRIEKTPTQNCFDIMNIDTHHRKIRMFRFGAGLTCWGDNGDRFLTQGLDY